MFARMQSDGNFVVYNNKWGDHVPLWASKTNNKSSGPYKLRCQTDNNLVIYDGWNKPIWASQTMHKGSPGVHLNMQNDGNLVLYDNQRKPIWASNTKR